MPLFDQKDGRKAKKAKPEPDQEDIDNDSGNDSHGEDEDAVDNPELSHGSTGEEEVEMDEAPTPKKSLTKAPAKKKQKKPSAFRDAMSEETYNKQMMAPAQKPQPQQQQQAVAPAQPNPGEEKKNPLKLRLDLNLDVEIELRAKIHGDITLALLDMN